MIWRDYSLNSSLGEMIKRYLEMSLENIKLRKELQATKKKLDNKQKVIRYYRKENKRMKKERDLFGQEGEFGSGKTLNRMLRHKK